MYISMRITEFDSIHMYSHILVGVGQLVLYHNVQVCYVRIVAKMGRVVVYKVCD